MSADISIVVPTHNRAHLVSDAIRSLLELRSQGLNPEVIVVNDGSTDGTTQVLRQFAQDIVIVESQHGERSKARNAGLARATAPLVGFLDDDDLCIPAGWQRLCARLADAPDLSFVYGRAVFTDGAGNALPYRSEPERLENDALFFSLLALGCHISMGTIVIRRQPLLDLKGFDPTLNTWEDWDLWLRLALGHEGAFVSAACAQIREPGWEQPNAHHWSQKLAVRARYCLEPPHFAALCCSVDRQALAAFYEQLGSDAFSHRLYPISRQAFLHWRSLSSSGKWFHGGWSHGSWSHGSWSHEGWFHEGWSHGSWSLKRMVQFAITTVAARGADPLLVPDPTSTEACLPDTSVQSAARRKRLAVVIPTYNRSLLVQRAIESVLAQTRPADEIIVVDDGSTDDTAQRIAAYPQVRLVQQENGGLAAARNAGIMATDCEWITLLDDDDWFAPEMLEEQAQMLDRDPTLELIYTATFRVDRVGKLLGQSHRGHRLPRAPLAALATENFILCSAVRVRRSVLMATGLFDTGVRLCEDQDLWLRVAASGARFGFIARPLAYITKQPGTMSGSGVRMASATIAVLERRRPYLESLVRDGEREWWLAGAHYRLGRVYWEAGDCAAAACEFTAALKYDPTHCGGRLYGWVAGHPGRATAFRAARELKRAILSLLQRTKLVESRWGS